MAGSWGRRNELMKILNTRRDHSANSLAKFGTYYTADDLKGRFGWTREEMHRALERFKNSQHEFKGEVRMGKDLAPSDVTVSIVDTSLPPVWGINAIWETFDENRRRGRLTFQQQVDNWLRENDMDTGPVDPLSIQPTLFDVFDPDL